MVALEIVGWIGSILIVLSLTQARVWRFRWMNLIGSVIATGYNTLIGAWPFVFMNAAIVVINIYWLVRLTRERHDSAVYRVLAVDADNAFLRHLLAVHATDIATHAPTFDVDADAGTAAGGTRHTFLVVRGDEAVGVVAVTDEGDGLGRVDLDWVKERFRDFTPGEFVYRESGALADAGFSALEVVPREGEDEGYLRRVGFTMAADRWVRPVNA
ncbi:hypothetical protein [Demequina litorisediminis]|uniref:Inner membrane protein n=1 Tax=Demequina litorisediminis TaxID=1849022 RepID=A0ABQ6ICL5_9MICO|nr:hypothetical protein [Demequina litorisediminis]GMA35577.1 hypothetical protein GCM10025876_17810 [Demequina litorisediminis]